MQGLIKNWRIYNWFQIIVRNKIYSAFDFFIFSVQNLVVVVSSELFIFLKNEVQSNLYHGSWSVTVTSADICDFDQLSAATPF